MVTGGSTVRAPFPSTVAGYVLIYATDNEFVQLMMQK